VAQGDVVRLAAREIEECSAETVGRYDAKVRIHAVREPDQGLGRAARVDGPHLGQVLERLRDRVRLPRGDQHIHVANRGAVSPYRARHDGALDAWNPGKRRFDAVRDREHFFEGPAARRFLLEPDGLQDAPLAALAEVRDPAKLAPFGGTPETGHVADAEGLPERLRALGADSLQGREPDHVDRHGLAVPFQVLDPAAPEHARDPFRDALADTGQSLERAVATRGMDPGQRPVERIDGVSGLLEGLRLERHALHLEVEREFAQRRRDVRVRDAPALHGATASASGRATGAARPG